MMNYSQIKKYFNIIPLILIFISIITKPCSGQTLESGSLTIKKAIELTINNFPLIKQAEQNSGLIDAKIKQQKSFDYPVINAEASYTRIGPIPSIGLPGAGDFLLAPANNYDTHIAAMYNLYDFGKKDAELNLLESYKKSASDNIDLVKSNLAFSTIQTFYSILFLQKSIAINDTDISNLNDHLDITNKKIESGTSTDYDLLSTKVRLADYKSNQVTLQNQLKNQMIILQHLTGLQDKNNIDLSGDFSILTTSVNTDSLVKIAFQQRQEIALALDEENSAHLKENSASLIDRPDLNVRVTYGLKNGFEPNLDAIRGNWSGGIGLSIPIFNGFRKDAQEEEALTNIKISELNTENIKLKISAEVQKAVENIKANIEQLQNVELKIQLAGQAVQKAKAQYASGVGTNLDLLDAETRLADAKFLYIQEIYKNILNTFELKKAVGDNIW